MHLLIKYIKGVLCRVAKRLSYIEDARCLKVKVVFSERYGRLSLDAGYPTGKGSVGSKVSF